MKVFVWGMIGLALFLFLSYILNYFIRCDEKKIKEDAEEIKRLKNMSRPYKDAEEALAGTKVQDNYDRATAKQIEETIKGWNKEKEQEAQEQKKKQKRENKK